MPLYQNPTIRSLTLRPLLLTHLDPFPELLLPNPGPLRPLRDNARVLQAAHPQIAQPPQPANPHLQRGRVRSLGRLVPQGVTEDLN